MKSDGAKLHQPVLQNVGKLFEPQFSDKKRNMERHDLMWRRYLTSWLIGHQNNDTEIEILLLLYMQHTLTSVIVSIHTSIISILTDLDCTVFLCSKQDRRKGHIQNSNKRAAPPSSKVHQSWRNNGFSLLMDGPKQQRVWIGYKICACRGRNSRHNRESHNNELTLSGKSRQR